MFAAVTDEVARLLDVDHVNMSRYDPDSAATVVGSWRRTSAALPVGSRMCLGGRNVSTLVSETGRPARIDRYDVDASGPIADLVRPFDTRSMVGVPISVEGRLWGVVTVSSTREESLPADTEARLAGFTELVATAIANAQARVELRGFAEEQAALRRVAMLVARAAPPEDVFAAVTAEVGRVLHADLAIMSRYDPGGVAAVLGAWSPTGEVVPVSVGRRVALKGRNVHTLVFETGRPARVDDYAAASGPAADLARERGMHASVGVPISVEGRLWGAVFVSLMRAEQLPGDTEARLAGFTELVATAIANAESQAQLTASRARIVAAADQARRRIERDLHDGAQQRLISLALQLRVAQAAAPPGAGELVARLDSLVNEATGTLDELRELARGIHPVVLAEGGLAAALEVLARRSVVPVELDVRVAGRLPEQIEVGAYYVVAEALTNAAKHARASTVTVTADATPADRFDLLQVEVRDDGRGGAELALGTGLLGLKDRVEALGGAITVESPRGKGTTLRVTLPITGV